MADVLFRCWTFLGDGLVYIPLLIYCIFFNRNFFVPVIISIVVCTFLTHFLKRVVFPHDLRPISLEAKDFVIHKISGVYINRLNSFPSGHTATAFSTALLLATVLKKKTWAIVLMVIPFLVGYSRVYLAQHFVTDVLAGIVVGIITALVALWLQPVVTKALPVSWQRKMQKWEPKHIPVIFSKTHDAETENLVIENGEWERR